MIVLFEYDPRSRWIRKMKVERIGKMTRYIWGLWSFAIFTDHGINDLFRSFGQYEREKLFKAGRLESIEPVTKEKS